MSDAFYTDLRDGTAAPLITEFGQAITLQVSVPGTFDPITGTESGATTATYGGFGVVTDYTTREIDGTVIQRGDKKVLATFTDTSVIPLTTHNLLVGSTSYSIQNVNSLEPGGVSVMYTLQMRR